MIHPKAEVHESISVPDDSMIWAFAVIEPNVHIGTGCVIGSHCFIGAGTKIGNNVRMQTGVFVPRNTVIEDDVFIGPHVVATDDKYPHAGNRGYIAQPPVIRRGASIGAGAVILPGVVIGPDSMIGAGAVVTRDVDYGNTVRGIPARKDFNESTDVRH